MFRKQVVNRRVAGDERQPVGQLKSPLAEASLITQAGAAQCRLMDQLQRQSRFDPLSRLPAPTAEQIPSSQPQVFGNQEP